MKNLLELIPLWVKIGTIVSLLSAIGIFADHLCNSGKRSLSRDIVDFKKEIKSKNDTMLILQGKIAKKEQDKKNKLFNLKMECNKLQKEEHEEPHIDANGNLYF